MFNYLQILQNLGKYLTENLDENEVSVKVTPLQILAGTSYDKLDKSVTVLLNLDAVDMSAIDENLEDGRPIRIRSSEYVRIAMSVGKQNIVDKGDYEVEQVIENILNLVSYKEIEGNYYYPQSISQPVIDSNFVYWRHVIFQVKLNNRIKN